MCGFGGGGGWVPVIDVYLHQVHVFVLIPLTTARMLVCRFSWGGGGGGGGGGINSNSKGRCEIVLDFSYEVIFYFVVVVIVVGSYLRLQISQVTQQSKRFDNLFWGYLFLLLKVSSSPGTENI